MTKKGLQERSQAELIHEIQDLRSENKSRRLAMSRYEETFGKFPEDLQAGLLQVLGVFGDDRTAGAELLRDLSNSVLGSPTNEPPSEEDNTMTDIPPKPAGAGGDDKLDQILELLQKQEDRIAAIETSQTSFTESQQQAEVNDAIAYLETLGYKQGTPEWDNIVDLAQMAPINGDLDKAHKLYDVFYPPEGEAGGEGEGKGEGEGEGAKGDTGSTEGAGEGEDSPKYPVTGKKTSVGGPKADTSSDEPADLSLAAVGERARDYLTELAASQP